MGERGGGGRGGRERERRGGEVTFTDSNKISALLVRLNQSGPDQHNSYAYYFIFKKEEMFL